MDSRFAQLHGNESAIYCKELGRTVLKALRVKDRSTFLALAEFRGRAGVRGFVLDAFSDQAYGGTGEVIDWQLAAEAAKAASILLAGGSPRTMLGRRSRRYSRMAWM